MNRSKSVSPRQASEPPGLPGNIKELSTFSLLRLLNSVPGDSAQHRAIEQEIYRRELQPRTYKTVLRRLSGPATPTLADQEISGGQRRRRSLHPHTHISRK
jgi:hypothetical protein